MTSLSKSNLEKKNIELICYMSVSLFQFWAWQFQAEKHNIHGEHSVHITVFFICGYRLTPKMI